MTPFFMIVVEHNAELLVVTQADHAALAAELLALWRSHGLPAHSHRDDILFAAREHDNGWREADSAPRLTSSGRPQDFREVADGLRREIWRRSVERYVDDHSLAALLITRHAIALHAGRRDASEAWERFLDALEASAADLEGRLGIGSQAAADAYRFIEWSDLASLAACGALQGFERSGLVGRLDEGTLFLDPFPLAGATTFELRHRNIENREYEGGIDLISALAGARWQRKRVRIAPVPADSSP